ncbi:protein of unknown function [Kyrpidia spormannii]|uniref:Uncharacterized protein n=1 Tax=Kyrpidia spormannii TaxID=2055160 RepID=A0ACA8ZC23_9BACL|nr:protein of unknown function [Kyrpidia spormannii]
MGPRSHSADLQGQGSQSPQETLRASMGPRSHSADLRSAQKRVDQAEVIASMGPRSHSADLPDPRGFRASSYCFNGAAESLRGSTVDMWPASAGVGSLQWGRGVTPRIYTASRVVKIAAPVLQWGRGVTPRIYLVEGTR